MKEERQKERKKGRKKEMDEHCGIKRKDDEELSNCDWRRAKDAESLPSPHLGQRVNCVSSVKSQGAIPCTF